jgi:hypothetical protein
MDDHRMRRTILLGTLGAALVPLFAGCTDRSPTLGIDGFPPGTAPVTVEVVLPASAFLEELGRFSGYSGVRGSGILMVAREYGGALDAHTLARFTNFPRTVTYRRGDQSHTDSAFHYGAGQLVVRIDTLSTAEVPGTLEVWELVQAYDPVTVNWELAVDSAGAQTAWQQPGGTRGVRIAEGIYTPEAGVVDSLVLDIDAATMQRLADAELEGVVVRSATPGTRMRVTSMALRGVVHPDTAQPDTAIAVTIDVLPSMIYTPEPPEPSAEWHAGGVRSARTQFRLRRDVEVPGCPPGQTCAPVPLSEVRLHVVQLRLKPVPTPLGFEPLRRMPLTIRLLREPELGRFAPLGSVVLDVPAGSLVGPLPIPYAPGDTAVNLPITSLYASLLRDEALPDAFALLAEPAPQSAGPATFGVAWFRPEPELHVVYTLPAASTQP